MNNINCICETFYNCCNIPIKAIDKTFKELHKYGYSNNLDNMFPNNLIKNFILKNDVILHPNNIISVEKNIHYMIIEKYNLYFILGPTSSNNKIDNAEIPFRPLSCLEYFENLLTNIIDDKLLFDLRCKSYNTYVRKSIEYVHNHYYGDINIDDLSKHLNINKSYFCNLFKKSTGTNFSNFLNNFRVEKSKKLLVDNSFSLLDVALEVGFNNQNYFTIVFKKVTNQTPSQFKKQMLCNKNEVY